MSTLSDEVYERIQALCAQGDRLAEAREYANALDLYWTAWDLLPEPKLDWEAATWLLGTIGDINFLNGDYSAGRDNLSLAMHCPNAVGNPFLHLRLGQCQFELHAFERTTDELMRAYMGAGLKFSKIKI